MNIGAVPDPRGWEHWKAAEALLEPARALGGFDTVLEPDEALWAVMDGPECIGAVTAWLGEGYCEVKLVGGRDAHRWISIVNEQIGESAAAAGAKYLVAFGRRGWTKVLGKLGWEACQMEDGNTAYRRDLN